MIDGPVARREYILAVFLLAGNRCELDISMKVRLRENSFILRRAQ